MVFHPTNQYDDTMNYGLILWVGGTCGVVQDADRRGVRVGQQQVPLLTAYVELSDVRPAHGEGGQCGGPTLLWQR